MNTVKLKSPDGTVEVIAHPSRVEGMIAEGWSKVDDGKPAKATSKSKRGVRRVEDKTD